MSRVVLSIGSNVGDRLAHLQSVVDGLGSAVRAVSPVYETPPWGGVDQGPFLNAVLIAESPEIDARAWLHRGQTLEQSAKRVREEHWGPRTLDVDVIACLEGVTEVFSDDDELTLPHPHAHQRAFVLVPWFALEPAATLTVDGLARPLEELLAAIPADELAGVRRIDVALDT